MVARQQRAADFHMHKFQFQFRFRHAIGRSCFDVDGAFFDSPLSARSSAFPPSRAAEPRDFPCRRPKLNTPKQ